MEKNLDYAGIKSELVKIASPSSDIMKAERSKYSGLPPEVRESFLVSSLAERIQKILNAEPELKGLMIRHGNGASNFVFNASQHLVRLALNNANLDSAITWLEKVLAFKSANIFEILPIWGVEIVAPVKLLDNVDLAPFSSLPDSSQKKVLTTPDLSQRSYRPTYAWQHPSAALIAKWNVNELYYSGDVKPQSLLVGNFDLLRKIRACISVIAPSTVIPAHSWYQFEDPDLNFSILGASYSIPVLEIQALKTQSFGNFNPSEAENIVPKYLLLEGETRSRVDRALDRFDRSMRRHTPEDAAVEMAIALECLFSDGGGEQTWKIGLRSALMIEGLLEEKVEARKIVRALYRLRGNVVHTGSSQREVEAQGIGTITTSELIAKGAVVTASVIKASIMRGSLPSWFEAEIALN